MSLLSQPLLVLATVPDRQFGSGSLSKPNRCQIDCPGRQYTWTAHSGTVPWETPTRLNWAGCQRVAQWVHL